MDEPSSISNQAKRMGIPLDDEIALAPELEFNLDFYIDCYDELSGERLTEGGRIPITAIKQYCKDWNFTPEVEFALIHHCGEIDSYKRRIAKEEADANKKSAESK